MLSRGKVTGDIEPLVQLYSWKDGSQLDPTVRDHASPFPNSGFMFYELDLMIAHFQQFKDFAAYHPRYGQVAGKYFPLFWDGSTGWLSIDLDPTNNGRIMLINGALDEIAREVYASDEAFWQDAIRANAQNDNLACF